jgi:hypothetical protein
MKTARTTFFALCFCLLAAVALPVVAQTAGYTKLNVKGRVQLEIPSDWTISDAEQRKRVKELGEKLVGIPTQHTASLAAQSYPAPSRTMVRVSFIPMEPPLTQTDVRQEVQANKQQVLQGLGGCLARRVADDVGGLGQERREGSWASAFCCRTHWRSDRFDHQLRTHLHGQSSGDHEGDSIPCAAGRGKSLITLSYIEGDPQATAAHNRLKSSIVIR